MGLMIKLGMAIEKTSWISESELSIVIKDHSRPGGIKYKYAKKISGKKFLFSQIK